MEISFTTFCVILGFFDSRTQIHVIFIIIYIYMSVLTMFLLLYTYFTILPNKSNQIKFIFNNGKTVV